jgi:PleD family two-component response regulator
LLAWTRSDTPFTAKTDTIILSMSGQNALPFYPLRFPEDTGTTVMRPTHADKILIVAHQPQQAEALKSLLPVRQRDQVKLSTLTAGLMQDSQSTLLKDISLIIIDLQGQQESGLAYLRHIAGHSDAEIIVLGEVFDEDFFINAYDVGVRDYLIKPVNTSIFLAQITQALQHKHLQSKVAHYETLLQQMGFIHAQSGLPSPRFFKHNLDSYFSKESAGTQDQPVSPMAFCFIQWDISRYPTANQAKIQSALLQALKSSIRTHDLLGEWEGHCYSMLLVDTTIQGAKKVVERFMDRLTQHERDFNINHLPIWFGYSDTSQCQTGDQLIEKAFSALTQNRSLSAQT